MDDLQKTLCEIQDHLAPQLDAWEQMLYHYIFRHTILEGKNSLVIPARSISIKIGKGRKGAIELSRSTIPRKLRSLAKKGGIKIVGKSRDGTKVLIILPCDIPGLISAPADLLPIDLLSIDFFSSIENRRRILERDRLTCRYCLRQLDQNDFTLDHIHPQAEDGDNSFKNLVAVCFDCNSRKQSRHSDDFLRENYRARIISSEQLEACLHYIDKVRAGEVIPD